MKIKTSDYTVFHKSRAKKGIEYSVTQSARIGFDAVEVFDFARPSQWMNSEKVIEMKKALSDNSLKLSSYSVHVNLLDEDVDDVVNRAFKHVEYASELGAPYFHHTIVPGLDFSRFVLGYDEVFERVIDNAIKIARKCNEYGIVCIYEPQGRYFNGVDGLKALLSAVKAEGLNVGVCGDLGNSLFADCKPVDIFKEFSHDIKHIHVKDYRICAERCEGAFVSRGGKYLVPVAVGEGDADVKGCLSYLKDYDGFLSFETEVDENAVKKVVDMAEECFYGRKTF